MKNIYFFLALLLGLSAQADNNSLTLNSHLAEKSQATTLSFQPSFYQFLEQFDFDLSFDATRIRSQVSYNANVDDFTIEKNSTSVGLDIFWNKLLGLGFDGMSERVNDGGAKSTGFTARAKIKIDDVSFKYSLSDLYIRQKDDFYVLNNEIKGQLTVRQNRQTVSVNLAGLESCFISLSYSQYKYDTDVVTMNSLLSAKPVLLRNGADFLSQIYSLIENDLHADFTFNFSDSYDLEFGVGESTDYLEPKTKSNDLRIGTTVYFKSFDLGVGASAVKPTNVDETLYSGDLRLTYLF